MRYPLTALVLAASSCISPQYGDTPFSCLDEPRCPDGYRCIAGVCRQNASDGAASDSRDASLSDIAEDPEAGGHVYSPFGAPRPLAALNSTAIDAHPSLTADMLEVFFQSGRGPGGNPKEEHDIWTARRASVSDGWSAPSRIGTLNTAQTDGSPEVSADGLTIFFSSARQGGSSTDIYVAKRRTREDDWSAPQRVGELSSSGDDTSPTPSGDLLLLMMDSSRTGGSGSIDLYVATRSTPDDPWTTPTGIDAINSSAKEAAPWFNADQTLLYLTSDRAGGRGSDDIWRVTRESAADPWGKPLPVVELNSTGVDSGTWLSADGSTVVFASDRGGNMDLFIAER